MIMHSYNSYIEMDLNAKAVTQMLTDGWTNE